jgi:hypothetical protein
MRTIPFGHVIVLLAACGGAATSDNPPSGGGDDMHDGDTPGNMGPVEPPPTDDPVEPVWEPDQVAARIKSPNQRMRFTAGLPFRILADGLDPRAYQCPPGHPPYTCADSAMTFFVDGAPVATVPPDPNNFNLWELRLPAGLPAGNHVLTVKFKPHSAAEVSGLVPIYIEMVAPPAKPVVELAQDVVLSGTTDLDWTNVYVKGNGHRVTSAPGYAGRVIIRDSLVTNLAAFDNRIGIDVTTTGAVDITGSTFEATAPVRLAVNGSAPVTINNNELRSSNYVTYVSADPNRSPILELSGNTAGAKTMQGNNIGAGIVRITGMSGWQIGGLRDSQSNIFVGPRVVLELLASSNTRVQGNYLHHDYYGGFSQGFNLKLGNGSNALAEHNIIRDSSWPVQSFGGELRYNLLINSGHNFVRSLQSGAKLHHNIFAHQQAPESGYDGAVMLYGGEQNIVFDSNTIDAGGPATRFDAPALAIGPSVTVASVRNNLFTHFSNLQWSSHSIIAGSDGESGTSARVAKADYNAFWSPASDANRYMPGIVAGTAGAHDVLADPKLTGEVPQVPARIPEGQLWRRTYGVSKLLRYYRSLYQPAAGSPLIDAGDPSDGAGNDIGAVGAGAGNAADQFGAVMTAD